DGGKTFRPIGDMHGDHHGLWIDPDNSDYMVNVNDGGVVISYDGGKNWVEYLHNLPLVQFFNVMYDMAEPFHVYGSIQDHGSYRGVVDLSRGRHRLPATAWQDAPGGEGSSHAIDPTDTGTVYSAGFYGNISRTHLEADKKVKLVPKPAKGEAPYRGQWLAPFIISPHNPRILYHGMNFLFRSMNRGDCWELISPDLTFNDPKKIGDIQYQTIFSISESRFQFGLIYVGTDDGRVHVTRDGGKKWTEIGKGVPVKWVSEIVASAFDRATVYMTQNGKRDDDFKAYVWKSVNYGKTWRDISGNIPCGPVNVIREDPANKNILYVGTDLGVYVSIDGGKYWQVLAGNFPTTFVHDLVIHPRDRILVAATHGRGMWAMDVSHLQQLDKNVLEKKAHLFAPCSAQLPVRKNWRWRGGKTAAFHYYLKTPQTVKL
ncbi:MAG: glycosyl hydrolase, partial [bacterium]|nr:glycosyl hydrolase [bacterium]